MISCVKMKKYKFSCVVFTSKDLLFRIIRDKWFQGHYRVYFLRFESKSKEEIAILCYFFYLFFFVWDDLGMINDKISLYFHIFLHVCFSFINKFSDISKLVIKQN